MFSYCAAIVHNEKLHIVNNVLIKALSVFT